MAWCSVKKTQGLYLTLPNSWKLNQYYCPSREAWQQSIEIRRCRRGRVLKRLKYGVRGGLHVDSKGNGNSFYGRFAVRDCTATVSDFLDHPIHFARPEFREKAETS